ncbi:putative GTP pyrophosphokinase [Halolactibacillus halophilus]|uniref:GTP pyrophosphokinase YwaC n=1 Tax=Halolactibacillus halophilus TaxID=306540 RepID=A0A1I5LEN0_9BACI|nr:GTP pyrophosphokinase family protein [Halolactibacillus halophilus]GEM00857.1 GTP pyrophosphokinase YwaC [Halolactibacillus halophilus]SFO95738.1 putative GTP pyrophosphokinase [Halolactibacillus halophilus]
MTDALKIKKQELMRFLMQYKFAINEMMTKVNILKQEFTYINDYNPIEHVTHRVKSPKSILMKVEKKDLKPSPAVIKEHIHDIAGIRITCSFESDIYIIRDMLKQQDDITLLSEKDYIQSPKPNGYRSLHLILSIPIFMSDRTENVCVEVQIRTIAMDFWASLEHKIYYKFNKQVPKHLNIELTEAAEAAHKLDQKMEKLHREMAEIKAEYEEDPLEELNLDNERFQLPIQFLNTFLNDDDL